MFFLEKRTNDFPKHVQCISHRIYFTGSTSSRRQNPNVVKPDQNHNTRTHQHHNHPGMYHSKFILQHTCQPNQASVGKYLGQIIKSSLPTDILGLLGSSQLRQVYSVTRNVMSRTTESNDPHQSDGITKKIGQRQRKCHQRKCQSGNDFCSDNKVLLRLKHLQKRTP